MRTLHGQLPSLQAGEPHTVKRFVRFHDRVTDAATPSYIVCHDIDPAVQHDRRHKPAGLLC